MKNKVKTLNCPVCGRFMKVIYRRDDGCRMFDCSKCDVSVGEETDKFFEQLKKEGLI